MAKELGPCGCIVFIVFAIVPTEVFFVFTHFCTMFESSSSTNSGFLGVRPSPIYSFASAVIWKVSKGLLSNWNDATHKIESGWKQLRIICLIVLAALELRTDAPRSIRGEISKA
jgi:hypothetical protein